jgi:hypothetical protein
MVFPSFNPEYAAEIQKNCWKAIQVPDIIAKTRHLEEELGRAKLVNVKTVLLSLVSTVPSVSISGEPRSTPIPAS